MKNRILSKITVGLLVISSTYIQAQNVGINTTGTSPSGHALLDLNTGNTSFNTANGDRGILPPEISLASTTDVSDFPTGTYGALPSGLLVYNTNAGMTGGWAGYWFWNGAKWLPFITNNAAAGGGGGWLLQGNGGTTPGTNFVGTTDGNSLDFATYGTIGMTLMNNGSGAYGWLGLGWTTPQAELSLGRGEIGFCRADAADQTNYGRIGMDNGWVAYFADNAWWNTGTNQYNYVNGGGYGGWAAGIQLVSGELFFNNASGGTNPLSWNTRMFIAQGGNVGVGTTSPDGKLETWASGTWSNNEGATNGLQTSTGHTNGTDYTLYMGADKSNAVSYIQSVQWGTATANLALNARGGNVGIATISPAYKLETDGDIYANGGWFRVSGTNGLYWQSYGVGWYAADGTWLRTYNNASIWANTGTIATNGSFSSGYGGAGGPAGGGIFANDVGIGTSAPATKLDVEGGNGTTLKIVDGNQAAGYILTSNASGVADWEAPTNILVYGNNAHSVTIGAMQKTNNWNNYSNIPGMTITMTTVHNTFYVFASLTCRLDNGTGTSAQFGQAIVDLEIIVDGSVIAWSGSTITDYDSHNGVVTTGTASFCGYPVTVAPGSHTITLAWEPVALWASNPAYVVCNPAAAAADECILTIFD